MAGGFIPSTPVDHQHIALRAVPGLRAAARHALLPRPRQPRVRQERAGRDALRRLRARSGQPLGGRRALGACGPVAAARLRALRPADGRGDPALPVPGRCGGHPAGLPSRRDDARRQPARSGRCPGSAASGSPPACRSTDSAGGGGIGRALAGWITSRGPGRRHRTLPGRPFRGDLPRSGLLGRPGPRDLLGLLPAALSVRRRPGRPAAPAVGAPRPPPGARRGLRDEGRLGATRPSPAGPAVATGRSRPGRLGLDPAALVRAGGRRGPGRSRAGRPDRPELVRQDRGRRPGRARACSSGSRPTTSTGRSAAWSTASSSTSAAGSWPT